MNFKTLKWLFATCIVLAGCGSRNSLNQIRLKSMPIQAHPIFQKRINPASMTDVSKLYKTGNTVLSVSEPLLSKKFNNLGLCRKWIYKRVTAKSL